MEHRTRYESCFFPKLGFREFERMDCSIFPRTLRQFPKSPFHRVAVLLDQVDGMVSNGCDNSKVRLFDDPVNPRGSIAPEDCIFTHGHPAVLVYDPGSSGLNLRFRHSVGLLGAG